MMTWPQTHGIMFDRSGCLLSMAAASLEPAQLRSIGLIGTFLELGLRPAFPNQSITFCFFMYFQWSTLERHAVCLGEFHIVKVEFSQHIRESHAW